WASSRWLATLLDKLELKGKKILEIGCGLALPSIVASRHGAVCTAVDIHPDVGAFLTENVRANRLELPIAYQKADWRSYASDTRFDYIVGSDILYEKEHPFDIARFLHAHLKDEGQAIIIDPCRWHHQESVRILESE